MDKGLKIVTIGGGSTYTPELIEGFINRQKNLPVREIWLVDIEAGKEKLEVVSNFAKRMVEKAGVDIAIHATFDRKTALKDADFVTTQLRVGQLDARVKDESIPLKYNVLGQETNGPGGLFKALRTIPVILDICKEMEELCPNAWLINFANPAGIVTEAVNQHSNITKVIGLCNGPLGIEKGIAKLFKVSENRIFVEFVGLNHMTFTKNIYLDGNNVTSKAVELMLKDEEAVALTNINADTWNHEFMKKLNMIPIGYLRYYFQMRKMVENQTEALEKEGSRAEIVSKVEKELLELYKNPDLNEKPKQLELRGGAYYSEAACMLIDSIYNDSRDIQTVNTLNRGAISDFDSDTVVEVNCVITKHGPIPLVTGELPLPIKGLVHQIKTFEKLTIKAALSGNRDDALLALTINPLVSDDRVAENILDEMLEAHKEFLPQFFK